MSELDWELLAIPGFAQMPPRQKAALYLDAKQTHERDARRLSDAADLRRRVAALEERADGEQK